MKYQSKIVGLGPDALAFLEDEDMNFIIIFNEDAPPELAELSVLHTKAELKEDPAVGDTLKIGNKEFKVSAVGWEAPHTKTNSLNKKLPRNLIFQDHGYQNFLPVLKNSVSLRLKLSLQSLEILSLSNDSVINTSLNMRVLSTTLTHRGTTFP